MPLIGAWYGGVPHAIATPEPLDSFGYRPAQGWMRFVRRTEGPGPSVQTGLRIEQVGPHGGIHFAEIVGAGFGMPVGPLRFLPGREGWTCLLAYDGDEPVAAASLFIAGDEAYLTFGATLEAARGRGAQAALLAERIAIAGRAGAGTVTTETGEDGGPSYRNILRAGFREVGVIPNWRYSGSVR